LYVPFLLVIAVIDWMAASFAIEKPAEVTHS
jgi:hypothetical protein